MSCTNLGVGGVPPIHEGRGVALLGDPFSVLKPLVGYFMYRRIVLPSFQDGREAMVDAEVLQLGLHHPNMLLSNIIHDPDKVWKMMFQLCSFGCVSLLLTQFSIVLMSCTNRGGGPLTHEWGDEPLHARLGDPLVILKPLIVVDFVHGRIVLPSL